MALVTRKTLWSLTLMSAIALAAIGGFIWSGLYNVGADEEHTAPVHALMETMRNRSIQSRAGKLQVPADLQGATRITQGAGNYNAMCKGCHLAPGMADTELSKGLYPAPPNLTKKRVDAAEAFWVIKHGIKASGMPAWGESMDDKYIWNMAAFLQELPALSAEQYQTMVAKSGGHDHGGGESNPHDHDPGAPDDHHDAPAANSAAEPHAHPPGTPSHDDAPADSEAHARTDDAPKSTADATSSASHDHPPGTPADHHATAAATGPPAEPAEPAARQDAPSPPPGSQDDGHDHQH